MSAERRGCFQALGRLAAGAVTPGMGSATVPPAAGGLALFGPGEPVDMRHSGPTVAPEQLGVLVNAACSMVAHLWELAEAKRARPSDDLLSALVATRGGANRLSDYELTSMVFLILGAGHQTTVDLIGNGMYTLLTNPGQRALLDGPPHRLETAVEELLRFQGPPR